jgi:Transposase DDE domain group 1
MLKADHLASVFSRHSELICWQRERCGKSEEAHAVMKDDLAGGRLPSGLFGANAAWWAIMVLAHNLNAMMKRRALGGDWAARRMKAMRFHLIALPGRVVRHARRLIVRLSAGAVDLIRDARAAILSLQPAPSG